MHCYLRSLVVLFLLAAAFLEAGCRRRGPAPPSTPRSTTIAFNRPGSSSYVNNPAFAAPVGPTTPTGPLLDFFKFFSNERLAVGKGGSTVWDSTGIIPGAVKAHLDDMLRVPYFSLVSPTGVDVPTRAVSSGATGVNAFNITTVVIARGYPSAERLVNDLMDDPRFASVVIGYTTGRIGVANTGGYWVIMITN